MPVQREIVIYFLPYFLTQRETADCTSDLWCAFHLAERREQSYFLIFFSLQEIQMRYMKEGLRVSFAILYVKNFAASPCWNSMGK
jgi:hypothetical protein